MLGEQGLGVPAHPEGAVDDDRVRAGEGGGQQADAAVEQHRHVCRGAPAAASCCSSVLDPALVRVLVGLVLVLRAVLVLAVRSGPRPLPRLAPGKVCQEEERSEAAAPVGREVGPAARRPADADGRGRLEEAGQHLLGLRGEGLLLLASRRTPRPRRPRSRAGCWRPMTTQSLVSPAYVAQPGRDGDPALLVRHVVEGAGEEHAAVVADRLGGDGRALQPLGVATKSAGLKTYRQRSWPLVITTPAASVLPEAGRQEQPALVVELRGVGAEEHGSPTPSRRPPWLPGAPRYSTFTHCQRPITPFRGSNSRKTPGQSGWSEVEWDARPRADAPGPRVAARPPVSGLETAADGAHACLGVGGAPRGPRGWGGVGRRVDGGWSDGWRTATRAATPRPDRCQT